MDHEVAPIETPIHQRVADFKHRHVPVIVWSVAALLSVWLLADRAARSEHIGLAAATQYEVSAGVVGRLQNVLVELYDHVEAGEIVAVLDDEELAARLARSQAAVRQLGAMLDATRAERRFERNGWNDELRRFETDEEDRRLAALELGVTIESDEIELERLTLELNRSRTLLETGLIGQSDYDSTRLARQAVSTRLEESKVLLAQTETEHRAATARREAFERNLPGARDEESLLRPVRESIEVENQRLREIQAQRKATVLRSPAAGQVSSILCRNGQTVVPGEPILTVTDGSVSEILAYLDDTEAGRAKEKTPVVVASVSRPGRTAESFVVRVGPAVEMLPQRLWREPQTPEYGRAVVIAAVPGLDLAPGELLSVRLRDH